MDRHPETAPTLVFLSAPPSKGNLRLKVVLLGLAILFCGVVIGAGGMLFWGRELVLSRLHRGAPEPGMICARLEKTLSLDPKQKTAIEAILQEHFPRIRELRQARDRLVFEEFQEMSGRITAVLTPAQAEIYRRDLRRLLPRYWQRHGHRRGVGQPAPRQ